MKYLFLCSIGPVQDFIATARKSRDLWFGSWLLSELSKAVAKMLSEQPYSGKLIFPAKGADSMDLMPGSAFNVANRILAELDEIPNGTLDSDIRKTILSRITEITQDAFSEINGAFDEKIAYDQVIDLTEYYWATISLDDDIDYPRKRQDLDALLAARKNTRSFLQPSWGRVGQPKSSLDGQRESVFDERIFDDLDELALYEQYRIRKGERLSGVGLLKRHGNRGGNARFLSTSHVAALPYLDRLEPSAKRAIDTYISSLKNLKVGASALGNVPIAHPYFGRYDAHVLYDGRLQEYVSEANLPAAKLALETFFKSTADGVRPQPYYALLLGDGDRMGKTIDNQKSKEEHRKLSVTLVEFAKAVGDIVMTHQGSLVYAGGDDVLAFVPVHTVLQCAQALATEFKDMMSDYHDADGKSPTFSVGITIYHHLEPLTDAIALTREAEHEAKTFRAEKNALAIFVAKRSGVTTKGVGAWGEMDKRIELFTQLHRIEAIPDGAAYQLRDLVNRLDVEEDDPHRDTLAEIIRSEAIRILGRKRAEHGKEDIAKETFDCLKRMIEQQEIGIDRLANEMIIAKLFAEVADLANQPIQEVSKEVCDDENLDN